MHRIVRKDNTVVIFDPYIMQQQKTQTVIN